jgi:hypothetical protein
MAHRVPQPDRRVEEAKSVFALLSVDQREKVVAGYCKFCWRKLVMLDLSDLSKPLAAGECSGQCENDE